MPTRGILKEYRMKANMSMKYVSSMLGVSESVLEAMENGSIPVEPKIALKFVCLYNLTTTEYNEIIKQGKEK